MSSPSRRSKPITSAATSAWSPPPEWWGGPWWRWGWPMPCWRKSAGDGRVLGVGGGAPRAADNGRMLRDRNSVVALVASPATLRQRLRDGAGRPMLEGGVEAALATLLPLRMARYQQADLVVPIEGMG